MTDLRAAVRSWFAARALAFRHDDRRPPEGQIGDDAWAAWIKRSQLLWRRVGAAEERMAALVTLSEPAAAPAPPRSD